MEEIKQYITYRLAVPQAAKDLLSAMHAAAVSLETMPSRHPFVDEEKWREQGIRKIMVKNFFYIIGLMKKMVSSI